MTVNGTAFVFASRIPSIRFVPARNTTAEMESVLTCPSSHRVSHYSRHNSSKTGRVGDCNSEICIPFLKEEPFKAEDTYPGLTFVLPNSKERDGHGKWIPLLEKEGWPCHQKRIRSELARPGWSLTSHVAV